MFGFLLVALVPVSPAFADDGEERVTASGTVWVDENLDGVRQPEEPVLSGVEVRARYVRFPPSFPGGMLGPIATTDEQGRYILGNLRKFGFRLEVYFKRLGYLPVRTFWDRKVLALRLHPVPGSTAKHRIDDGHPSDAKRQPIRWELAYGQRSFLRSGVHLRLRRGL